MVLSRSRRPAFTRTKVALGVLSATGAMMAQALQFQPGDVDVTFNTQVTLGASWRAGDPDDDLIAGPNIEGDTDFTDNASSSVTDDGNANYEKGDLFSLIANVRHDLSIEYENVGAFVRAKYWYDYALADKDVPHGNSLNNYAQDEPLEDEQFSDLAQAHAIELMDAYVYGSYELGSMPLDLRVGRQVLSWGESTFIQNSVNIINPADVSALRRPGAELKDALLPLGMFYGSLGITPDFTVEAFVLYEWEQTQLEGCGTYFSSNDVAAEGCNKLTLFSALNSRSDEVIVNEQGANNGVGTSGYVARTPDDEASDSGQRGLALRYFAESLNSTEFGLFYVKYHSRLPVFSVRTKGPANSGDGPNYFFEYPEGIEVYAGSFNTTVAGWALSGELSYRPHMPVQINTTDMLQPLVSGALASWSPMADVVLATSPDTVVHGYQELEFTQLQFTLVKFFDRVLGASRLSFVSEVGFDWIGSLPENEEIRFERSPAFGTSFEGQFGGFACAGVANINPDNCKVDGYLTDFSWGYRMRGTLEYPDVFGGVTLKPGLAWSHDVEGFAPTPNFNEGSKAISMSLDAEYLSNYTASIAYTNFVGGDYNPLRDRDFYSLSVGVSF
jgi:hypothetical protein